MVTQLGSGKAKRGPVWAVADVDAPDLAAAPFHDEEKLAFREAEHLPGSQHGGPACTPPTPWGPSKCSGLSFASSGLLLC